MYTGDIRTNKEYKIMELQLKKQKLHYLGAAVTA